MDLNQMAQDVLAYLTAAGVKLSDDLGEAEVTLRDQLQRIGARALELHLTGHKLGYEGSSRACPCEENQHFLGHRAKQVVTLLGPVTLRRAYYHCPACGASSLPYDERIGLGAGAVSPGLARSAMLLAVHEPFAAAAKLLKHLTGQRVSEATIRRLTHRVGGVAAEAERRDAEQMEDWQPPAAQAHPDRLYTAVDGVMIHRLDGWHEAKVATCYWQGPDGQRAARYAVRWELAEAFPPFAWATACRCGMPEAKERILLGDGARWIWDRVGAVLENATHIVDWYHAMEHIWACGRELHGESSPDTTRWVQAIETLLWEGNVRGILARLQTERARARAPTQRQALDTLRTYLENQDDRLAYDRFRARGLDIGSGRVEAACKAVVGARMKRAGMRWSTVGAQATLSLRCAWLNQAWDNLWSLHPLAA